MKNFRLTCFSLLVLFFLSPFVFASTNLAGKYTGMSLNSSAQSISLNKAGLYATEILVINNTPYSFVVDVPYSSVHDWVAGNRVYRIVSDYVFPTTNVRIGHPDFGYVNNYVSNFSIISFSLQGSRLSVITVEYH